MVGMNPHIAERLQPEKFTFPVENWTIRVSRTDYNKFY